MQSRITSIVLLLINDTRMTVSIERIAGTMDGVYAIVAAIAIVIKFVISQCTTSEVQRNKGVIFSRKVDTNVTIILEAEELWTCAYGHVPMTAAGFDDHWYLYVSGILSFPHRLSPDCPIF